VEIEELDVHLDELEVRLERLRALYEQYFLGIEKIEPTIPRKDVDRRIYVLRREKIRNTGRRFKLQTIIQRYNTFQQYWQRICREIENGTYRRHLQRAERNMGPSELLTVASRRRFGRNRDAAEAEDAANAAESAPARSASGPPSQREMRRSSLPPRASVPPGPSRPRSSIPSRERPSRVPASVPAPRLETPTLPRGVVAPLPPLGAPPLSFGSELDSVFPAPPPAAPRPNAPARGRPPAAERPAQATAASRPAKSIPPKSYESLELDMDFMGDWDPTQPPPTRGKAPPPRKEPKPQPAPERPAPPPASPAQLSPAPAAPQNHVPGLVVAAPPETTASSGAAAPRRVPSPKPMRAPRVVEADTEETSQPERRRSERATHPGLAPPPAGTPGPPRPPATQRTRGANEAKPSAPTTSLTEDRLKALHSRLSEANQKANQPAPSLEGLSRSLKAAEAKLRTQHGNRRIEFEVVLKDGKPIVKPVVR
jgi:hypothetical protein